MLLRLRETAFYQKSSILILILVNNWCNNVFYYYWYWWWSVICQEMSGNLATLLPSILTLHFGSWEWFTSQRFRGGLEEEENKTPALHIVVDPFLSWPNFSICRNVRAPRQTWQFGRSSPNHNLILFWHILSEHGKRSMSWGELISVLDQTLNSREETSHSRRLYQRCRNAVQSLLAVSGVAFSPPLSLSKSRLDWLTAPLIRIISDGGIMSYTASTATKKVLFTYYATVGKHIKTISRSWWSLRPQLHGSEWECETHRERERERGWQSLRGNEKKASFIAHFARGLVRVQLWNTEGVEAPNMAKYVRIQRWDLIFAYLLKQDPGRTVKQEQEEISHNHVQTFISPSVFRCI